ncbi:MAG: PD-(D/E)XK nuclease domain-containing protein [Treponema sp.]|nr:PD-(D/E)XK nuclease domain-containing protein [Treponema sp.]
MADRFLPIGIQDLFKGLAIEKLEKDWLEYPVIKISFGRSSYESHDSVFIFELKMDKSQPFEQVAEEALAQIDENGYSQRFAVSGKTMYKVALVFSSEGKGLFCKKANF